METIFFETLIFKCNCFDTMKHVTAKNESNVLGGFVSSIEEKGVYKIAKLIEKRIHA